MRDSSFFYFFCFFFLYGNLLTFFCLSTSTVHSSMTKFLVPKNHALGNQTYQALLPCIHCVLIFYFNLPSIEVLFIFLAPHHLLQRHLRLIATFLSHYLISLCMTLITTFLANFLPMSLIATFSLHYLSVSACH